MNCYICNKPKSKIHSLHKESKKYILCINCNCIMKNDIIKPKIQEFIDKFVPTEQKDIFNCTFIKNKSYNNIFNKILSKTDKKDLFVLSFNNYIDKEIQNYNNIAKNKKPFDNIQLYNYDNTFYHYTNAKKIKKLIKLEKVIALSDTKLKFKEQKIDKHNSILKKTKFIENKCINCGSIEYLRKINILIRTNMNDFLKNNISVHFYYAVCSSCEDYCNYKKLICDENIKKEYGKSCVDYINELYETQNYNKIIEFVDYYTKTYLSTTDINNKKFINMAINSEIPNNNSEFVCNSPLLSHSPFSPFSLSRDSSVFMNSDDDIYNDNTLVEFI